MSSNADSNDTLVGLHEHRLVCRACGSIIEERQYQIRAADEAHTSIWSCSKCPLDPSRIRFSDPVVSSHPKFNGISHRRTVSDSRYVVSRNVGNSLYLESFLVEVPLNLENLPQEDNIRYSCAASRYEGEQRAIAYYYAAGIYSGSVVSVRKVVKMSPRCRLHSVDVYNTRLDTTGMMPEKDGVVRRVNMGNGTEVYIHSREVARRRVHSIALQVSGTTEDSVRGAIAYIYSLQQSWPNIRSFVSRDQLALFNNLSPRAWDSKRIQKRDAIYSPKVDGERAYVILYRAVAHIFGKGKGYPHIGWRVLPTYNLSEQPIVIDVENTLSHGCFLIDMLTDSHGKPSPRERDYSWSLDEFTKTCLRTHMHFVKAKPYYKSIKEAEDYSSSCLYPTDGIIALWKGSTTARKMKIERSIELLLDYQGNLATSDGDVVIYGPKVEVGIEPGSIVEVRFTLCKDGKSIVSKPIFKRLDKSSANSTSAVMSVLASFSSVRRDDETRRRNVLMWCDSLKSALLESAIKSNKSKKIILDIGSGTGQSLDILTADKGVSYLMVEPDAVKCQDLARRVGIRNIMTNPREILSSVRHLKSGSQTYAIINCKISEITEEEEVMSLLSSEVCAATALFSAHFVVLELYDMVSYWSIPVVGCFYPYDETEIGHNLIDCLGIRMRRISSTECTVRWGRDREYAEPYTNTSEYQLFSAVMRGIEMVPPPSAELDKEVYDVCEKVHVLTSL